MQRFIQCDGSRENMVGGAEGMTILDVEGWWIPEKMFVDVTLAPLNCLWLWFLVHSTPSSDLHFSISYGASM